MGKMEGGVVEKCVGREGCLSYTTKQGTSLSMP